MANTNNIVSFMANDIKHQDTVVITPELLNSAKRIAKNKLGSLLQTMFNNVDDCLFEYADKAKNNQQQLVYFDAMREIRIKKDAMVKAFFTEFETGFNQVFTRKHSSIGYPKPVEEISIGLSLVDDDELEESLAITNMVNRIYTDCREALAAMVHRMNEVCESIEFSKEQNPLSPQLICGAFEVAVDALAPNLEIKLIVFKLFDKFVVRSIGLLYDEVNQMFIAAGVLPTIKYRVPVRQQAVSNKSNYIEHEMLPEITGGDYSSLKHSSLNSGLSQNDSYQSGSEAGAPNVFDSLRTLLGQYRSSYSPLSSEAAAGYGVPLNQNTTNMAGTGNSGSYPSGYEDAQYFVTQDVISGLSHLQTNMDYQLLHNEGGVSAQPLKTFLMQAMPGVSVDGNEKAMGQMETDTIDIVSMMFDFILDDKTLPEEIKSLIARLQIPMVKVALMDNTFFAKRNHPARQLLNELAGASDALKSSFDSAEELVAKVADIVNRIINEFENDVSLFELLLEEFSEFMQKEIEAYKMAEDMILQVKENVAAQIEQRVKNKRIPQDIAEFLKGPWNEVTKIIGIRDGCEGLAWNTVLTLIDDLIWSVQPKIVVRERQQLSILIPKILQALQEGLMLICYEQEEINGFFKKLEKIHLDAIRLDSVYKTADSDVRVNASKNNAATQVSDDIFDNIVLQSDKHDTYQFDISDPELMRSEYFEAVKSMPLGTWVEFKDREGNKRGKLAWKCDFTGEFTFLDRMYKVIADINMRDLIMQLDHGNAAIINDVPLFDRAVDAVINGMKNYVARESSPQQVLN